MNQNPKNVLTTNTAKRDTHEIPVGIVYKTEEGWGDIVTLTIQQIDDRRRKIPKFMVVYDDCHLFRDHIEIIDDPSLTEAEWIKKVSEEYLRLSDFWTDESEPLQLFRKAVDKYISELDYQ